MKENEHFYEIDKDIDPLIENLDFESLTQNDYSKLSSSIKMYITSKDLKSWIQRSLIENLFLLSILLLSLFFKLNVPIIMSIIFASKFTYNYVRLMISRYAYNIHVSNLKTLIHELKQRKIDHPLQ